MVHRIATGRLIVTAIVAGMLLVPTAVFASGEQEEGGDQSVVVRFHGRVGPQGDHFDRMATVYNDTYGPGVTVETEHFPGPE